MTELHQQPTEFTVTVDHASYDPSNDAWRMQVTDLFQQLSASDIEDVRHIQRPVQGRKGGPEAIIIALGSAGAIQAAVTVFRAWLARDRDRRISLTWNEGTEQRSASLDAENISESTAHDLLMKAVNRANNDG